MRVGPLENDQRSQLPHPQSMPVIGPLSPTVGCQQTPLNGLLANSCHARIGVRCSLEGCCWSVDEVG
jgi:hypothetical protein